jgi:glycerol-3-phosphate O-acyltransferase
VTDAREPGQTPKGREYRYGFILRWLYKRFFSRLEVDERFEKTVVEAARSGTVVYVLQSLSFLDYACLNFFTKKLGLPMLRFVNDVGQIPFRDIGRMLRYWFGKRRPDDQLLEEVVESGSPALVFLKRPGTLRGGVRRGIDFPIDYLKTLVVLQRRLTRRLVLVPPVFVWGKRPAQKQGGLLDFVFGGREWPGRLRMALQFLWNWRHAVLRVGEPLDLQDFVQRHESESDAILARRVRYALLRRLDRERRVVVGPLAKSPARLREEILRSPKMRSAIADAARSSKKPEAALARRADGMLREIESRLNMGLIKYLDRLFDWVWNRIYDGIEVDPEGLQAIRDAAREGTLVLLPSHKSHVDYLVLSDVFYDAHLVPPQIAAGINLSFWPLGAIFRRGGAFFIRRSFKGDRLYAAVLAAYVRKLLSEDASIEFFIEGGRSRTGKLLPPKLGMLSMVLDAARELPRRKVFLVPISIVYERVVEGRGYLAELRGGEKERETLGGLLRAPKVLSARYGRVHIGVGKILPVQEVALGAAEGEGVDRTLARRVAHRVTYEINRATPVTASALVATALLSPGKRGISRADLLEAVAGYHADLRRWGAKFAVVAGRDAPSLDGVEQAIRIFRDAKLVQVHDVGGERIYRVPEEVRLELDYYRNNLVHWFVPAALVATAMGAPPATPLTRDALADRVRRLSRLFKYEFMFRADAEFDTILGEAVDDLVGARVLEESDGLVRPRGESLVPYRGLLRHFLEAYRVAARVLAEGKGGAKERVKRALAEGERMYLRGEIDRREALSKPLLENAFAAFREEGGGEEAMATGAVRSSPLEARLLAYLGAAR